MKMAARTDIVSSGAALLRLPTSDATDVPARRGGRVFRETSVLRREEARLTRSKHLALAKITPPRPCWEVPAFFVKHLSSPAEARASRALSASPSCSRMAGRCWQGRSARRHQRDVAAPGITLPTPPAC
jgi:hypothetical protein